MIRTITTCLLLTVVAAPAVGANMKHHRKPEKITFRIVATADPILKSSFSTNYDALLANLVGSSTSSNTVKVVFRYMGYEDGWPTDFVDYNLVHMFKALRDRSCDETWQSFSTKTQRGPSGTSVTSQAVRYTATAPVPEVSPEQLLPCYVIEAGGYKGSKQIPTPTERMAESKMEGQ